MAEGSIDYVSVNDAITSGSPAVASQRERATTAVNRFDCTAHEQT